MAPFKTAQKIIQDTNGNEVAMIRVDKNLKEMMAELPSSRWSSDFWHPKYEVLLRELGNINFYLTLMIY